MILRPAVLVAMAAAVATWAAGGSATALRILSQRAVPLARPSDVRWLDDDHVLIADVARGLARLGIAGGEATWLDGWPIPKGPGQQYVHLAASDDAIVAADFAFGLQWRAPGMTVSRRQTIEYVADVDVDGDRLLVSGLRRDSQGRLGADGSVAWIGSLREGEQSLRPVLPFRNRKAVEDCAGFGLGVVRFLKDGSFIVVPGAEPGIYLFGKDARLQRVWQTGTLDLDVDCDLSREQQMLLATSPVARQEWVNRRRIVDEVVETPAGPAVIARKVTASGTHWDAILLGAERTAEVSLPIESPSPWAHVAAASRGGRSVFLVADRVTANGGAPPRLFEVAWTER